MRKNRHARPGTASVEMAVLLPFLVMLFVIALDWARIFYAAIVVDNCARNGAMYLIDPYATAQSPYASLSAAALADAPNLAPQPTVTSATGTDANNRNYADCTVSYNFQTLTNFPGVPRQTTVTR